MLNYQGILTLSIISLSITTSGRNREGAMPAPDTPAICPELGSSDPRPSSQPTAPSSVSWPPFHVICPL